MARKMTNAAAGSFKMSRVSRRAGILAGIALALACAGVPGGAVAGTVVVPEGSEFAYVRYSAAPPRIDVKTVSGGAGSRPDAVAGSGLDAGPLPYPSMPPSWSPGGETIAFAAREEGSRGSELRPRIYLVRADGAGARSVRGTRDGVRPVFMPDGRSLAFALPRYRPLRLGPRRVLRLPAASSIWVVRLRDGAKRRLARAPQGHFVAPSSVSPGGRVVLGTRVRFDDRLRFEAVAVRRRDGAMREIRSDASEPVFSPDGSRIALVRHLPTRRDEPTGPRSATDLFVQDADGSGLRRVTRTGASKVAHPNWDPTGERLGYTLLRPQESGAAYLGFGDSLMQVNADGTCDQRIIVRRHAALFGPVWRPGPGRGAGRIEC